MTSTSSNYHSQKKIFQIVVGNNTKIARLTGQSMKPRTNTLYFPLINKIPADPSTIAAAMSEIWIVTRDGGQEVSVFTYDQQSYLVVLDVIWANLERWETFYSRIDGTHWVMSFTGCIGKLMANSGLEKVVSCAFPGVNKMLIDKSSLWTSDHSDATGLCRSHMWVSEFVWIF